MGRRRNRIQLSGRALACALGSLLTVGVMASPAWANTVPDAPPQPAIAASSSGGVGQIVVTFAAPGNNGGDPITQYTAACSSTDGGTPNSNSNAGAVTPITVSALTPGDHYTCNVVATNLDGPSAPSPDSAAALVVGVPDTPPAPTVTLGNGVLNVNFTPPNLNGGTLVLYSATCTSSNGGTLAFGSAATLPLTATGGTIGKTYTCHVDVQNSVGGSADSPTSAPIVISGLPGAPSTPALTSGDSSIVAAFTPGAANGDAITSNTASCTSTNGGAAGSNSGASSAITVTGLTNGKNYLCSVTSTNHVGTGTASPTNSIVAGLPNAAGQPTVMSGDSQIVVNFTPPSLNGSPLVAYNATCISSGNPTAFGSGSGSPVTATGALNGQSYSCHVTAVNSIGDGPDSPQSAAVIPAGEPGFPAPPTIAPGNGKMVVTFVAPVSNGAPITSYTATCTSTDGGATGSATGTSSPIDVTGLTNGNTYTCDVSATNSAGPGPHSDESDPAVANAVPNAPGTPTVAGGASRVVVSFVLPADNGNAIFKTSATCTSSNGGVTGTHVNQPTDAGQTFSPIIVTGLTNGKSYTCKVTATNSVGTSPTSPASAAVVPRSAPGAPTSVVALSGNAPGTSGPVNVSFAPGNALGSAITSFRATCTDLSTGLHFTKSGPHSPLALTGVPSGHAVSCVVVDISLGGTSVNSAASKVTEGAPGAPTLTRILEKNRAVTLSLLAPPANGKPITRYVGRCTSTNGGVARGSASAGGQIVVTNLSFGASYVCTVTATNARGEGAARKTPAFSVSK